MRALLVTAAAVVITLSVGSRPAGAGPPRDGGRYADVEDHGSVKVRIKLTLANDGGEFGWPSFVEVKSGRGCVTGWGFAAGWSQPRAAPVRPGGRFSKGPVRGRFTRGGRFAVGTVSARAGCTSRRLHFSAPLRSTPKAVVPGEPSGCDRLTIRYIMRNGGDEGYELSEQGVGCTRARAIGREFHAERSCSTLESAGTPCVFGTVSCERIRGGRWRRLASIRCSDSTRPGGVVELAHHRSCAEPEYENDEITIRLWAINIPCETARLFPFVEALDDGNEVACERLPRPQQFVECASVAGFACRTRTLPSTTGGLAYVGSCRDVADPFRALRFAWLVPP